MSQRLIVTVKQESGSEVVHRCPPGKESLTPCCGETPFELNPMSRMTLDPSLVTCGVFEVEE